MDNEQELQQNDATKIKSTPVSRGAAIGATLGVLGKGYQLYKNRGKKGGPAAWKQLGSSALLGSAIGLAAGNAMSKHSSVNHVKETNNTMNNDLMQACEMAKFASDMSIPVEQKVAPQQGTAPVPKMTTDGVYDDPSKAAELAKAQQIAACAAEAVASGEPVEEKVASLLMYKRAGVMDKAKGTSKALAVVEPAKGYKGQASEWLKNNPKAAKGLKYGGGAALAAGAGLAAKKGYDAYKARKAQNQEEAAKTAAEMVEATPAPTLRQRAAAKIQAGRDFAAGQIAAHPVAAKGLALGAGAAALGGLGYAARNTDPVLEIRTNPKGMLAGAGAALKGIGTSALGAVKAHPYISGAAGLAAGAGLGYGGYRAYKSRQAAAAASAPEEVKTAAIADANYAEAVYEDAMDKMAYAQELYADAMDYFNGDCSVKVASVVSPYIAEEAVGAAENLYNDCVEKMAAAEELYADAVARYDYATKLAADFSALPGTAIGATIGATAGATAMGAFMPQALSNNKALGYGAQALAGAAGGALGGFAANMVQNKLAPAVAPVMPEAEPVM